MLKRNSFPAISVVMPVHNCGKYLGEALESIVKQSFSDFECIIINDGSTDDTQNIIKRYQKDARLVIIDHPVNLGIVASLNEGFKKAKGKYIIRMDGDDISLKNRFYEQINFMNDNPEVGICATWIQVFGGGDNYIWRTPIEHDDIVARSIFETPIAHPSVMMRRSVIQKFNLYYNAKFTLAEDYELWTRAGDVTKLHSLPKVLLCYRVHARQTGQTKLSPQKQMGRKIRLRQLAKLNIRPKLMKQQLHETISHWAKVSNFNDVRQWLNSIALANEQNPIYNPIALNNILIEKWLGLLTLYEPSKLRRLWLGFHFGPNLHLPSFRYALEKLGFLA